MGFSYKNEVLAQTPRTENPKYAKPGIVNAKLKLECLADENVARPRNNYENENIHEYELNFYEELLDNLEDQEKIVLLNLDFYPIESEEYKANHIKFL